jgi:hypothetical protein
VLRDRESCRVFVRFVRRFTQLLSTSPFFKVSKSSVIVTLISPPA